MENTPSKKVREQMICTEQIAFLIIFVGSTEGNKTSVPCIIFIQGLYHHQRELMPKRMVRTPNSMARLQSAEVPKAENFFTRVLERSAQRQKPGKRSSSITRSIMRSASRSVNRMRSVERSRENDESFIDAKPVPPLPKCTNPTPPRSRRVSPPPPKFIHRRKTSRSSSCSSENILQSLSPKNNRKWIP